LYDKRPDKIFSSLAASKGVDCGIPAAMSQAMLPSKGQKLLQMIQNTTHDLFSYIVLSTIV